MHAFIFFFFFNDTATTEIYTLSLHDALPIFVDLGHPLHLGEVVPRAERSELGPAALPGAIGDELGPRPLEPPSLLDVQQIAGLSEAVLQDRKSTRLNSSHVRISYAVFCFYKI